MGHAKSLNDHEPEEEVFVEPALAHHSPEASQAGEVSDAVFGEVGADGPNYRSVSTPYAPELVLTTRPWTLTTTAGRLGRRHRSIIEVPNRSWCTFGSFGV